MSANTLSKIGSRRPLLTIKRVAEPGGAKKPNLLTRAELNGYRAFVKQYLTRMITGGQIPGVRSLPELIPSASGNSAYSANGALPATLAVRPRRTSLRAASKNRLSRATGRSTTSSSATVRDGLPAMRDIGVRPKRMTALAPEKPRLPRRPAAVSHRSTPVPALIGAGQVVHPFKIMPGVRRKNFEGRYSYLHRDRGLEYSSFGGGGHVPRSSLVEMGIVPARFVRPTGDRAVSPLTPIEFAGQVRAEILSSLLDLLEESR